MGSLLVVCTGNICRSPVAEAALRSALPEDFVVSSAGTHAAVGRPAPQETLDFVSRELGIDLVHVGQQLTKQQAESADLIITMTREHRAWVANMAPRAVRRTFTLRELDEIFALSTAKAPAETLRDIAVDASRLRSQVGTAGAELDISDPFGGPPAGYESSFQEVLASSQRVANAIRFLPPTV